MAVPFVGTDVLIRLLTGDDPAKQAAAATLFEQVEAGQLTLAAPDTVIADAVFVLASSRLYHVPHAQVTALLTPLVRLPHFQVQHRRAVLRALELYGSSSLDFGDALLVASMERQGSQVLYAYDADFDHIAGISRREP